MITIYVFRLCASRSIIRRGKILKLIEGVTIGIAARNIAIIDLVNANIVHSGDSKRVDLNDIFIRILNSQ